MNTLTKFLAGASFLFALTFAPGAQAQQCYEVCDCSKPCNTLCMDGDERSRCGTAGLSCVGNCAKSDPRASAGHKKASDGAAPACDQQQDDKASEEAES
ncbi:MULTISPECIES: hypothetical protein [unclassified Myxococcus]|uniref:hypothetical protein n=1 Tax=unclassified Myxococcus TaxID=2648731 RepID=UPI00159615DB|nr:MULTISPECIES: hypothetical protein [unclassified Myxococcus]NVJ02896.1 hypothetical protein [Myxococcus sp. AM009]NVJ19333.1 hypothetical protein [Myxococcus sp. AM010]WIG93811.1 hypothetical protein KGD87_24975 [Myxococcus sp. SDU36]